MSVENYFVPADLKTGGSKLLQAGRAARSPIDLAAIIAMKEVVMVFLRRFIPQSLPR